MLFKNNLAGTQMMNIALMLIYDKDIHRIDAAD